MPGKVLFIVNEYLEVTEEQFLPNHEGDQAISERLKKIGFDVELANEQSLPAYLTDADKLLKTELIFVSSTAIAKTDLPKATELTAKLIDLPLPIIVMGEHLLAGMKMCATTDLVFDSHGSNSVKILDPSNMMARGLSGIVSVSREPIKDAVINLYRADVVVASINNGGNKAFLFGYRTGSKMHGGTIAPARRVGIMFSAEIARNAKEGGWLLFEGAIDWATKASAFADVFRAEWREIQERRRQHQMSQEAEKNYPPKNLVGLALSGGGIRSATFSLGLLQKFQEYNLLRIFDYLSTVSGGGYVGGWWSAWLSRSETKVGFHEDERQAVRAPQDGVSPLFPQPERIEPARISKYLKGYEKIKEGSLSASQDPIHHLRLFSNYLTPRKGLLSGDTWQAVSMLMRNLILTWVVLLPLLFSFVLVGQFYFVLQNNSSSEFLIPFEQEIAQTQQALAALPSQYAPEKEEVNRLADEQLLELENRNLPKGEFEKNKEEIERQQKNDLAAINDAEREQTELFTEKQRQLKTNYQAALMNRLALAAYLIIPILIWLLVTTAFWLRVNITPQFIDKIAHAIPSVIFWMLIVGVVYLSVNFTSGNFSLSAYNPLKLFLQLPPWVIGVLLLIWLVVSGILWWQSLPFAQNKRERVMSRYAKGNLLSLILTLGLTFMVMLALVALQRLVIVYENGVPPKFFWLFSAIILISGCLWFYSLPRKEDEWEWRKLVHGNRIVRLQTTLTVSLVGVILVLALSGYGYEIAEYIFRNPTSKQTITDYVAKAGGWIALIASIAGSIFTAIKNSPTGGEDKHKVSEPSMTARLIIALTPPLVLVCLAVAFAWLSRWMLIRFKADQAGFVEKMQIPIAVCIVLYLFLAIYEIRAWKKIGAFLISLLSLLVTAIVGWWAIKWFLGAQPEFNSESACWMPYCYIIGTLGAGIGLLIVYRIPNSMRGRKIFLGSVVVLFFLIFSLLANKTSFANSIFFSVFKESSVPVSVAQSSIFIIGLIGCGVVAMWEIYRWDGNTKRSISLLAFTYVVLAGFLFFTFFSDKQHHASMLMGYLTLGLLFIAYSLSVALGWMSDPNMLSMHMFYKSRLMRAYLGASNPNRRSQEITESATGDDILLKDLNNCQRGAPFHLINTTLNLVGGKDLATAQRSSDYFVLSKLYSGSSRTGYRKNLPEQYMQGQMTLGTAIAVSGAAVSPNMGAKTQTSAVAMLLTLLNVRLGYWAPTPNRRLWRSSQAGLWPFYILKEFLSQTNDLSSYCYLTDGGHFDNTGLYSLVERGCLYIVVSDNGADPNNRFEDLGEAIRRCRIDFRTEIDLDVTPLFAKEDDVSGDFFSERNFIAGSITYDPDHLRELGWSETSIKTGNQGVIIVIKPSLVEKESVDLRQYMRQNKDFPQQSTSDLWYDEAQFESYRKLGEWCAQIMIEELKLDKSLTKDARIYPEIIKQAFDDALEIYENGDDGIKKRTEEPTIPYSPFLEV
ncbi:MAG: hypothetical protein AB1757_06320 [Acidobacteriota bacterium]